MKFCYADESGHGAEITVVAGVIVDSLRMHRTKSDWNDLISDWNRLVKNSGDAKGSRIFELKGRELYRGNAAWRKLDGGQRTALIELIISWMCERKHKVTFGAVSKTSLFANRELTDIEGFQNASPWCIAAMHLILGLQRQHQNVKKNKGHTLFVFDHVSEGKELLRLVRELPDALGEFYKQKSGSIPLDQVIDVPYFADSKDVELIQVADLIAFILRLYSELREGLTEEKFQGERERLREWIGLMQPVLLPDSSRWKRSPRGKCESFLRRLAPASLVSLENDIRKGRPPRERNKTQMLLV